MEHTIEKIQLNDHGVYKCIAENAMGTQNDEIEVQVLIAPKVKIFPDSNEMIENSNYSLRCIVDGIKEERAEILWLDNDENVLQNVNLFKLFLSLCH